MKNYLLTCFVIISTTFIGKAQNLVQNGDFEQHSSCPSNYSQINFATSWINPCSPPYGYTGTASGSSDYYNACATTFSCDVPVNNMGYQPAKSGNGYAGILLYYTIDFREYVEVSLSNPLVANQCYQLTLYASLSNKSRYAVDSLGVYFSDTLISGLHSHEPLPYTPQLQLHPGFISDTLNWMFISTTFTATGGENYMIIGNFNNDANTNLLQVVQSMDVQSYIYIDDVCLVPCGNSCTTGIEEQKDGDITVYPNPVVDILKIKNTKLKIRKIKIYDVLGKEIFNQTPELTETWNLNIEYFNSGIYFIEISDGINVTRKMFMKQ